MQLEDQPALFICCICFSASRGFLCCSGMKANVILKKAAELFIIAKSPKVNIQSRFVATHKFKTTADI